MEGGKEGGREGGVDAKEGGGVVSQICPEFFAGYRTQRTHAH